MAALKVNYENNEYLLDLEELDTDDTAAMARFGVKTLKAFEEGISEGDPVCLTIAYWLMLKQNGEPGARLERVKMKPIKFLKALAAAEKTGVEDEEAGKDEAGD